MLLVCAGWIAGAMLEWMLLVVLHFRSGLLLVVIAGVHIGLVVAANAAGVHAAAQMLHRDGIWSSGTIEVHGSLVRPISGVLGGGIDLAARSRIHSLCWSWVTCSLLEPSAPLRLSPTDANSPGMFTPLAPRPISRALSFFCCGLWLEAAGVTGVAHVIGAAVLCVSAAGAIAAYYAAGEGAIRLSTAGLNTGASALFTLILAFMLTTGAIRNERGRVDETPIGDGAAGAFKGVVLSPDMAKTILLVAPPRAFDVSASYRPRVPVRIPFNGVYWYFRFPDISAAGRRGFSRMAVRKDFASEARIRHL